MKLARLGVQTVAWQNVLRKLTARVCLTVTQLASPGVTALVQIIAIAIGRRNTVAVEVVTGATLNDGVEDHLILADEAAAGVVLAVAQLDGLRMATRVEIVAISARRREAISVRIVAGTPAGRGVQKLLVNRNAPAASVVLAVAQLGRVGESGAVEVVAVPVKGTMSIFILVVAIEPR